MPLPYQPVSNHGNITSSDMSRGEELVMTNGPLQGSPNYSDDTEIESLIAAMFNLEILNEGCPDWTRGHVALTDGPKH